MRLTYPIVFEKIAEGDGISGHYYAHVPLLGLTTHGAGIDGARAAVLDLLRLWVEEKRAAGETVPQPGEFFFSTVDVDELAEQKVSAPVS